MTLCDMRRHNIAKAPRCLTLDAMYLDEYVDVIYTPSPDWTTVMDCRGGTAPPRPRQGAQNIYMYMSYT